MKVVIYIIRLLTVVSSTHYKHFWVQPVLKRVSIVHFHLVPTDNMYDIYIYTLMEVIWLYDYKMPTKNCLHTLQYIKISWKVVKLKVRYLCNGEMASALVQYRIHYIQLLMLYWEGNRNTSLIVTEAYIHIYTVCNLIHIDGNSKIAAFMASLQ